MPFAFPQLEFYLVPVPQYALEMKLWFDGLLQRVQCEFKDPPRAAISTLLAACSPRGKYRAQVVPAFALREQSTACRITMPARFDHHAWAALPAPPASSAA